MLENEKEIVLSYGMTGSGKSTMINSLLFGPGALQLEKMSEGIPLIKRNGNMTSKKIKRKVIDLKQDFKSKVDFMSIGHSN